MARFRLILESGQVSRIYDLVDRSNVYAAVIVKNPSDFIGAVLGASQANRKADFDNAVGKLSLSTTTRQVPRLGYLEWLADD